MKTYPLYFSPADTWLDEHDPDEQSGVRMRDPRVGTQIGDAYTLLARIGKGSGGTVFRALHEPSRRQVAIKLLHHKHSTSSALRQRFERESRTAATIRHPNIVRLFDAGIDRSGTPWQAMELLDGRDLDAVVEERPLTVDETCTVGVQLLSALECVHNHGFVHRDVKPENVFLTFHDDGRITVKLLDFGIVKAIRPVDSLPAITEQNMLLGTPQFMAPEQITGDLPVGPSTDVWAVGAVLFTALAGHPPFDDAQLGRLLTKIARENAPSIAIYRPDVPLALAQVIARALRQHPDHRYLTAADMERALAQTSSHIV